MESIVSGIGSYRGLAVIGVEFALVVIAFLVCAGVARIVISRLSAADLLGQAQGKAKHLQRTANWLFLLLAILACVAVAVINGYYIYKGEDIYARTREFIANIPPEYWTRLGLGLAKISGLAVLAWFVIRMLRRGLSRLRDKAMAWERIRTNEESVAKFFRALNNIQTNGIWLYIVALSIGILALPATIEDTLYIVLRIYLIVAIGLLVTNAVAAIVDSMDAVSRRYAKPGNWLAGV